MKMNVSHRVRGFYPKRLIVASLHSFVALVVTVKTPCGSVNGHEMQAESEEVIFCFLWCRGFVWKAEFDALSLDDSSHVAY